MRRKLEANELIRREAVGDNIGAHLQCLQSFVLRIIVNALVFPSVSKVALIRVEQYQPAFVDKAKPLGGLAVMLMHFRWAARKVIHYMINWVRIRDFDQWPVRIDPFDFTTKTFIQAIVVVNMKESAAPEVLT